MNGKRFVVRGSWFVARGSWLAARGSWLAARGSWLVVRGSWFVVRGSWLALGLLALCGCGANYSWRSSAPAEVRTVTVPTFRNESDVSEAGAVATRQLLREFQREGTFRIRSADEAALEIQGVIKSVSAATSAYDRRGGLQTSICDFAAQAEVSVIDKRARRVLIDNRPYQARASGAVHQDLTTAMRDVSGRLMDDLARQVVDDVLNLKW